MYANLGLGMRRGKRTCFAAQRKAFVVGLKMIAVAVRVSGGDPHADRGAA